MTDLIKLGTQLPDSNAPILETLEKISREFQVHPLSVYVATVLCAEPGLTLDELYEQVKSDLGDTYPD